MKRSQRFLLLLIPLAAAPTYLAAFHADPGTLATAHDSVGEKGCATCHGPEGLDAGCLSCHKEITAQLEDERGYHHYLAEKGQAACSSCHSEHRGAPFHPLNANCWPDGDKLHFKHEHLASFPIAEGRHAEILTDCDRCHIRRFIEALPSESDHDLICKQTYLGLDSDCRRCHENPHGERLPPECADCHDQEQWKEAVRFDHDKLFSLNTPDHANLACEKCHVPHPVDPVGDVKGSGCADCHEDPHGKQPHQSVFSRKDRACEDCHDPTLAAIDMAAYPKEAHSPDAFPLEGHHAQAECDACHPAAKGRRSTPPQVEVSASVALPAKLSGLKAEDCARCHEDVHASTSELRIRTDAGCARCHSEDAWQPSSYGAADHADLPLVGPHGTVACAECHGPKVRSRPKPGQTARQCADCHKTPHRHFKRDCKSCHPIEEITWRKAEMTPLLHASTGFPVTKPHDIPCEKCHDPKVEYARRYRSIKPEDCRRCHGDPHRNQFRGQACLSCHSPTHFRPSTFEVAQHAKTRFALSGAHLTTTCLGCHPVLPGKLRSGKTARWRRYRGRPTTCKGCHENPHGKQFDQRLQQEDCSACHDDEGWKLPEFDHSTTRFALGRAHEAVACDACHEERAGEGKHYRPLDTACASCHTDDPHLGQFTQNGAVRCDRCHSVGAPKWAITGFDHTNTRFPLDGAHIKVDCAKCHKEFKLRGGQVVVRYRPLAFDCKACHGSFDDKKR